MTKMKIKNVLHSGKTHSVDAEKFEATREAYLEHVPETGTGATPVGIKKGLVPSQPPAISPYRANAGWRAMAPNLI